MPKYYAKYRCLLCGAVFTMGNPAEIPTEKLQALLQRAIEYRPFSESNPAFRDMSPPQYATHHCGGLRIGLAEFSGFGQ